MAVGVYAWSQTATTNANADSNINWSEGQLAPTLNNSARAMMAALKAWVDAFGGASTHGGSSSDYTIANPTPGVWSAYASGQVIALKANHTNDDTAVNVNVDSLGNKRVKTSDGGDPQIGDIVSGGIYLLAYDGTNFQILNTLAGGAYQPLDATLTALAALSTSADQYIYATGADTFALATVTSFARTLLDDTTAAAVLTTLGVSAFVQTILNDADAAAVLTTLGVSAFAQTILDDANAAAVLATVGAVSLTASETIAGSKTFSSNPTVNRGGAGTDNITIGASNAQAAQLAIRNAAGQSRLIDYQSGSSLRWRLQVSGTAESGSNAGSNFSILAYDDSAAFIGTGLSITRATLGAAFGGGITVGSNIVSDTNNTDTLGTSGVRWANVFSVLGNFSGALTADTLELGGATDATLARLGAGSLGIEGVAIVTETATQTLTNKTLTSPTINGGTASTRMQAGNEATGTLTAASANDVIHASGNIEIPASVFVQYDTIIIYAGASARTITQGAGGTQRLHGSSTTGNLTLAARGMCAVHFISATEWVVTGDVS